MSRSHLKTVQQMFRILGELQILNAATATELAEELDMPNSTVHDYLRTLSEEDFLVKDENGKYKLSLKFLEMGASVRQKHTIFPQVEPILAEIADETGENTHYIVESFGKMVFVGSVPGEEGMNTAVDIGLISDLHRAPEGMVLLAFQPKERREELIDAIDFPIRDGVTESEFRQRLTKIRENKYAVGDKTLVDNTTTISMPIIDNDGNCYGAILVAGPTLRLHSDRIESIKSTLESKIANLNLDLSFREQS